MPGWRQLDLTRMGFALIIVAMMDQIRLYIPAAEVQRPEWEILGRAVTELSPVGVARLQCWQVELESAAEEMGDGSRAGAAESGWLLSRERYVPSDGVLVQDRDGEDE
ncbi:MAG: hypothetical protein ACP5JJ_00615 [Anaerolineae bacterium]